MRGSTAALIVVGMLSGCAPSHRLVNDGNVYFEYCYGADFDARIAAMDKEACWNAWLAHYTRHQPAQRVDYAMRRVEAIQAGQATLQLPGLPSENTSEPTSPAQGELAGVLVPEKGADIPGTVPANEANSGPPPPHGCTATCDAYRARCVETCPKDSVDCLELCERERTICLGGCY